MTYKPETISQYICTLCNYKFKRYDEHEIPSCPVCTKKTNVKLTWHRKMSKWDLIGNHKKSKKSF